MLFKSIILVAVSAVLAAAASPPACLLGAVNTYDSPSSVSSVCKEKDVASTIAEFCGQNSEEAIKAFADICDEAGVEVATDLPSSATRTSRPTGTSNASATGGSASQATGTGGAAASGTATTGGPAEATGAAGKLEIGAAALVLGALAVVL